MYSTGKYSQSICQRCGFATPYLERKREKSGLYVCSECYDGLFQAVGNPMDKYPKLKAEGVIKDPMPNDVVETSVTQITGW